MQIQFRLFPFLVLLWHSKTLARFLRVFFSDPQRGTMRERQETRGVLHPPSLPLPWDRLCVWEGLRVDWISSPLYVDYLLGWRIESTQRMYHEHPRSKASCAFIFPADFLTDYEKGSKKHIEPVETRIKRCGCGTYRSAEWENEGDLPQYQHPVIVALLGDLHDIRFDEHESARCEVRIVTRTTPCHLNQLFTLHILKLYLSSDYSSYFFMFSCTTRTRNAQYLQIDCSFLLSVKKVFLWTTLNDSLFIHPFVSISLDSASFTIVYFFALNRAVQGLDRGKERILREYWSLLRRFWSDAVQLPSLLSTSKSTPAPLPPYS